MGPALLTFLVFREGHYFIAQGCEWDMVAQGRSTVDLRKNLVSLLGTWGWIRRTRGSLPLPAEPSAAAVAATGGEMRSPHFGPIPIVARWKVPSPYRKHGPEKLTPFRSLNHLYAPSR